MNATYRKIITDQLQALLKPQGFKKKGNIFSLKKGDITYYIETQSSSNSTKEVLVLTVNIQITSELLARISGSSMPEHHQQHYTERIGLYLPCSQDYWWTVNSEAQAVAAGKEITTALESKVLPELFVIRSYEDLVTLWSQGKSPGLTNFKRLEYLHLLDIHGRLGEFNITLQRWIDALDDYTLEQLRLPPQEGHWSLGQVYRHILDDTDWFVGQMSAALNTKENRDKEMHADAKRMFANNGFPDIQIQGPATNTFIPQPESAEELRRRLVEIRDTVNRLFGNYDVTQGRGKTQHPGLLYFNAGEWLQYAEMHMRHHLRQKERIDAVLRR